MPTWGKDAAKQAAATPADEYDPEEVNRQALAEGANTGIDMELLHVVERIERLEEEKSGLAEDIKEVYAEAKGRGFDVKILRQTIRRRKGDLADVQEADSMLHLYETALARAKAKQMPQSEDGE